MTTEKSTEPASVAETLRRAKALIEDPQRWIKNAEAQTSKRGLWVPATHSQAGAWCMIGALKAVDGPFETAALQTLATAIDGYPIIDEIGEYNDKPHRRHRDVMKKFDKAIAAAEKAQ